MEDSINNNNKLSSKDDNNEERVIHWKSDNIQVMITDEADEVIKNNLMHLKLGIKIIFSQWEVVSLSSIMFSYCIINIIE